MSDCNKETSSFNILKSNFSLNELIKSIIGNDSGKDITINGDGKYIFVNTTETSDSITFDISYNPYIPLTINSFSTPLGLQLIGTTISSFSLNWEYNKAVASQSLNNGLVAPQAVSNQTAYSLNVTGANITQDTTITLTADDDLEDTNNPKQSSVNIRFGNYIYQTTIQIAERDNITEGQIQALTLSSLPKTLKTNRNLTFLCSSLTGEYEVILVPTRFNLTSGGLFKDIATGFTGGWSKIFTTELTNEAGHAEDYDVYVSANKNLQGLTFEII